ncbi:hypothetical protein SUGI_0608990 [Cryptomeria japonica]|nr:hypothetical protein SUGI_0608990 [Cryptomeria japonica]
MMELGDRRIVLVDKDDEIIWHAVVSGEYNVKLGYEIKKKRTGAMWLVGLCLNKVVAPCVRAFLWVVLHERILTRERLRIVGIVDSSMCPLCLNMEETTNHLLYECQFASLCWDWFLYSFRWQTVRQQKMFDFLSS